MLSRWRMQRQLVALAQSPHAALATYANANWPDKDTPLNDVPLLALDFELDGLGKGAHILQAGWVPFSAARLAVSDAFVSDVRSKSTLNDASVTVHGIGEQRARQGLDIASLASQLLEAWAGRIVVAHGADIEAGAIQQASHNVFGKAVPVRAICTLSLERRLHPNAVGEGAYRLGAARARYGLPDYSAHDALTDALAAAELFLAQRRMLSKGVTIGDVETCFPAS